ncbi:unnamed protein product [Eruca vesicaria subsp. sativa]|uniref:C2H2-type domain-containing protein n=1 Tax=Eruca vesicaria subsp. sativa TaxID=29727 RepID=A0ABC8M3G8_ERUVS|nr:unnamed protein product [Eruca vesicaria subsp. sativa]
MEFVCKYCDKKFPSGKSLGGHIRIHSPNKNNNKRRLLDQREIASLKQQQQHQCNVCSKSFCSVKALDNHMDCHNYDEGDKMVIDTQSTASETTTTSSGPAMIKRSKKQQHSNSQSFSSDPEIVQGAKDLMFMHLGTKGYNLAVKNSLVPAESSENNSEILQTKFAAAAADDDDDSENGSYVSDSSDDDDDYFMNGTKKSDSDISVGGSLRNSTGVGSGFNSFSYGDELHRSKRVSPSYESDSSADTNIKIPRYSDSKKAIGANKNSKGHHVCPICFKVYSSGQALGGHKRSHTIANQRHRITHTAADMQLDLNVPAQDDDDE